MSSLFSFDSTCFFENVSFAGMKQHKQMIKTETLNLKHKKGSYEKSRLKNFFRYGGHPSLVSRFRAWWQGLEQSGFGGSTHQHLLKVTYNSNNAV